MITNGNTYFAKNNQWQEQYLPQVKLIIQQHAGVLLSFEPATPQQDMNEAFDMSMGFAGRNIALRLRNDSKMRYRDLTLRYRVSSGAPTEYQKIKAGKGDLCFYGWVNDTTIKEYMLIDLSRLRTSGLLDNPPTPTRANNNDAGTSYSEFISYDYLTLREHRVLLVYKINGELTTYYKD